MEPDNVVDLSKYRQTREDELFQQWLDEGYPGNDFRDWLTRQFGQNREK